MTQLSQLARREDRTSSSAHLRPKARVESERRLRVLEHYSESAAAAMQLGDASQLSAHLAGRVTSPQNDGTLRLLGRLPLFAHLGRDDLAALRGMCRARCASIGTRLFEQREESTALYILLSGSVEISVAGAGRMHEVVPGEVFGEIGFVTRAPRSAAASALQDCTLLVLDYERLDALCASRPVFAAKLARNIAAAIAEHVLRMNGTQSLEHLDAPSMKS